MLGKVNGPLFAPPEQQKVDLPKVFTEVLPPFLDRLEDLCCHHKFLVSDQLTIADFYVGGLYTNLMGNPAVGAPMAPGAKEGYAELLAKYPNFKAYGERLVAANLKYLSHRAALPL